MIEAAAVAAEGRITPHDLGLWNDPQAQALQPIVRFIQAQEATPAIQLAHAGRKGSCAAPWRGGHSLSRDQGGWRLFAPSSLPFSSQSETPQEMSAAEIELVVSQFVAAARRALAAGFRVVEVHMAHGYLLHTFLSPLANQRKDNYGGSLENRMRFPLRVAAAVREVWPEILPMFVRISATDWVPGGWDLAQSLVLAAALKEIGTDLIDCSSGGLITATVPSAPGFQTIFSERIRRETSIATGAVGLITEAIQAEHILVSGQADAVFLGRELLRNPTWPLAAAQKLGASIRWPLSYERASSVTNG